MNEQLNKLLDEYAKKAIEIAMLHRCEEQGHVWKRQPHVTSGLECKWCGFRL